MNPRSAALTASAGLILSLFLCEALARILIHPTFGDRVEISDSNANLRADCYPRAPGTELKVDLARPEDARAFFGKLTVTKIGWPTDPGADPAAAPTVKSQVSAKEYFLRLIFEAPLCAVYDVGPKSTRWLVEPAGFHDSIAILGDSFAFGQGVSDAETFPVRLAALTHSRVRSYATPGANLPEIQEQFSEMWRERKKYHFTKVLYLYVLNDIYVDPTLAVRMSYLNDLMNVRLSATPNSPHAVIRFLGKISARSALARAALRAYSTLRISQSTLSWYLDIHDPKTNSLFERSGEIIGGMAAQSREAGMRFVMMSYPLMLPMHPYPLGAAHENLALLAKRHRIEMHDLLPAYEAYAGKGPLTVHPIDMHPNGRAHAIAASDASGYLLRTKP
ncbi:MAG: hypothetical protein ACXVB9_08220 [Bdellovibrionota bacterium]